MIQEEKQCLAGIKTLVQSTIHSMPTRETPAPKAPEAASPWREPRDICFNDTKNFPYPRRNTYSTDWSVMPIATQEHINYMWSIQLPHKRFSMLQITLWIKYRANINFGLIVNLNLWREMTWSIHLATKAEIKIAAWCWWKRC